MTDLRIRQLVIAADSLDTADTLQNVLNLKAPFPDPGVGEFGLVNAVFAIGDQFLEIIVPVTDTAPARRFIDRNGEGGYMAIFQVPDMAAARAHLDTHKARRVWNIDLEDISASHLHPGDIGGAIVSIDEPRPPSAWRWGGPDWAERSTPGALTGARLESSDPAGLAQRWATLLGVKHNSGETRMDTADGAIEFAAGLRDGLVEFSVSVPDRDAAMARAKAAGLAVSDDGFELAGTTFRLGSA